MRGALPRALESTNFTLQAQLHGLLHAGDCRKHLIRGAIGTRHKRYRGAFTHLVGPQGRWLHELRASSDHGKSHQATRDTEGSTSLVHGHIQAHATHAHAEHPELFTP